MSLRSFCSLCDIFGRANALVCVILRLVVRVFAQTSIRHLLRLNDFLLRLEFTHTSGALVEHVPLVNHTTIL